jgi:hypothetical protein
MASAVASVIPQTPEGAAELGMQVWLAVKAEAALARQIGVRAASKAAGEVGVAALKAGIKSAAEKGAARLAAKQAAEAAVKAGSGPAGFVLLATGAGGMALDYYDPFNLARAYDEGSLADQHDMVATAMGDVFKHTQVCTDASFTAPAAGSATSPAITCDGGVCVGIYQTQAYPNLKPPATASCSTIEFPSALQPAMPAYAAALPQSLQYAIGSDSFDGVQLWDAWRQEPENASVPVFADAAVNAEFAREFGAALVRQWAAAGKPAPVVEAVAPTSSSDAAATRAAVTTTAPAATAVKVAALVMAAALLLK